MEFFNLNENSVLVSWKDEVNSSLTRLISSYKTEILSLCKDDIKDCIQSIKSILIIKYRFKIYDVNSRGSLRR